MRILIKGVQFVNKGALLMLHAVLEQVRRQWPDAEIATEINPNSPFLRRCELGLLQYLPLRFKKFDLNWLSYWLPNSLRQKLRHYLGIVLEADVDVLLDASGFAYGDQWPLADLERLCGQIRRLNARGKKTILLPQAFGPFSNQRQHRLIKEAFALADLICARDADSFQYLQSADPSLKNVKLYPDFTISLSEIVCDDENYMLIKPVAIIPNYQMLRSGEQWRNHYEDILIRLARMAQQSGQQVVLINHEGKADMEICQRVASNLVPKPQILEIADPRLLKGYIKASRLVVSSRFHGCVSALASGTPCIGTSWSHKYQALFDDFAAPAALIAADSTDEKLAATVDYAKAVMQTKDYQQQLQALTTKNQKMWQHIAEIVQTMEKA